MKGFKVYELAATSSPGPATCRRDFYRIYLLSGPRRLHRAGQVLPLGGGPCLCVGNPYPVELGLAAGQPPSYACLFTEAFMRENGHFGGLAQWARLHGQAAIVPLRAEQAAQLTLLFQQMLTLQDSAYRFKSELLHSYLQLVLHEALRAQRPVPRRFHFYFRSQTGMPCAKGRNRW